MSKKKHDFVSASRAALRFTRAEALRNGILLKRFRQVHAVDSDLGPEWVAEQFRGSGWATVWHPHGEKLEQEARESCAMVKEYGPYLLFGISFYPPLRNSGTPNAQNGSPQTPAS